jgi:hypothetical protein
VAKLTPEERADLERRLKEDDDAENDYEVEIGSGDKYARVPYGKAKKFLQDAFGLDLDAEPKQDDDDGKGKKAGPKAGEAGGQVRAFGRRVG